MGEKTLAELKAEVVSQATDEINAILEKHGCRLEVVQVVKVVLK